MQARTEAFRRYQKALQRRQMFDSILSDCYRFAVPNFDPTIGTHRSEGSKNDVEVFDDQAMRSLTRRVARMHGNLFPPGEPWLAFDLGSMDIQELPEEQRQPAAEFLAGVARAVHAALDASNFHLEIDAPLRDCMVSTGCIAFNEGTDPSEPFWFEHVPINQIVIEEGPRGVIETVFRPRSVAWRDVPVLWPDAVLGREERDKVKDQPDETAELLEAQLHRPDDGTYRYGVYLMRDERQLLERTYRTKPLIAFRLNRIGGETMGRGPVSDVRATIKTLNKVKELLLKNASINVTGLWQADDDGVLNPATIRLVPGAVIPKAVGSSGLQRLASAADLNLAQFIIADLQASVKEAIEGPPLPPLQGDRRTAYEFSVRERELSEVEVPAHLRFFYEFDRPFALRCLDILSGPKFMGTRFHVPAFGAGQMMPKPASPLSKLREQAELQRTHQAVLAAGAIAPEAVPQIVAMDRYLRRFLLGHGLPPGDLLSDEERRRMAQQAAADQAAAAQVQGVAQGAALQKSIAGGDVAGAAQVINEMAGGL